MTSEDAFLQDILEHPEDDAPRLVYADWLEEHGNAERAEFIRVQCELARLAPDHERYGELQARERRLYVAHAPRWAEGVPYAIFRRGFVDELEFVEPAQFVQAAESIFRRHPVRSVWFTTQDEPGWGPELAACPYLARLHTLSLRVARSHHVAAKDLLAVTGSPHLTGLRALDVGENRELTDRVFARMIGARKGPIPPAFRGLRKLVLDGGIGHGPLGDRAVASLVVSPLAGTLTHLDLSGNSPITPAGFQTLFDSPLWPRLEELRLASLYQQTAEAAPLLAEALGRSRLKRLDLAAFVRHDRALAGQLARGLAAAPSWGALRWLDLSRLEVGGEGVRALAGCPHLAGLSRLDLHWCELSNADLKVLAGCPLLGGLTALKLDYNPQVGDAGLRTTARSPYLTRLAYLNLGETNGTDAGVIALAGAPNSARLRVLVLPGRVSDKGLKALAESPHLARLTTLVRGGMGPVPADRPTPKAKVSDGGVRALVDSPNLRNLTYLDLHPSLTENGQRALLEARHVAWPNLSEYDLKSPELKALYKERFGGSFDYELRRDEPFLTWLP
jgi:uncharacterized protein (TIGR02996 family)